MAHYTGELLPDSVAVMEYQMIISMQPDDTLTRNKLGMVYLRQKNLDKAKEQFLDILKIDARNFDALDSLGIVCDRLGYPAQAVGWYTRALKIKDDKGCRQRFEAAKALLKAKR
ncbi:MAG: tetratricopeptide repeat protein [Nitrospirota bacterium]